VREQMSTHHIRRATLEAIEHCARFETSPSARVSQALAS
jgi:hypothetical protein